MRDLRTHELPEVVYQESRLVVSANVDAKSDPAVFCLFSQIVVDRRRLASAPKAGAAPEAIRGRRSTDL